MEVEKKEVDHEEVEENVDNSDEDQNEDEGKVD